MAYLYIHIFELLNKLNRVRKRNNRARKSLKYIYLNQRFQKSQLRSQLIVLFE